MRFGNGQGNGGRRGVAVLVHIDEHALARDAQAAAHGFYNAQVGLVGHQQVHIRSREAVFGQHVFADLHHAAHGMLVRFTPLHADEKIFAHGVAQAITAGGAAAHDDKVALAAVAQAEHVFQPGQHIGRTRADHAGRGRVAKEHAGGTVRPVDPAAEGLGADKQNLGLVILGQQRTAEGKAVQKTGTGGTEVKGHDRPCVQLPGHNAGH